MACAIYPSITDRNRKGLKMRAQYKEAMRQIRIRMKSSTIWKALEVATNGNEALKNRITKVFNTNIDQLELKAYFHKRGERHGKQIDSERNSVEQARRLSVKELKN